MSGFVVLFLMDVLTYGLYALLLLVGVREQARPESQRGGYRVARSEIGVSMRLIGFMVLTNAITVVLAQIPAARLAEGRRRVVTMALDAFTFVIASLVVAGAGLVGVRVAATWP